MFRTALNAADNKTPCKMSDMNTQVSYMYRDGANYKISCKEILAGELTQKEIEEINGLAIDGEYFYPGSIGLPATNFVDLGYQEYDDDPEWHELQEIELTKLAPTADVTAAEFLETFRNGIVMSFICERARKMTRIA